MVLLWVTISHKAMMKKFVKKGFANLEIRRTFGCSALIPSKIGNVEMYHVSSLPILELVLLIGNVLTKLGNADLVQKQKYLAPLPVIHRCLEEMWGL